MGFRVGGVSVDKQGSAPPDNRCSLYYTMVLEWVFSIRSRGEDFFGGDDEHQGSMVLLI